MTSKMSSSCPREFILRRRGQAPTKGTNMERHFDEELKLLKQRLLEMADLSLEMIGFSIRIPKMAALSQKMVKESMDAFVNHDPVLAHAVCEHDDEVDWINDQIFRVLLTCMMENAKSITRAVDLILVSRNLERIADHATNIGEEVIFIEEGKNIKHHIQKASQ